MVRRAISLFPAFIVIGILTSKGKTVPFPDALPELGEFDQNQQHFHICEYSN